MRENTVGETGDWGVNHNELMIFEETNITRDWAGEVLILVR